MAAPGPSQTPHVATKHTLFGHPTGLFALFFAEMWERFSYYGMRALLVFYMTKGFLGYDDTGAYRVFGAYVALVYMTPFFGGAIADRLLGARRAVVLGGLLMAAGHLTMTIESAPAFYSALALLVVGNGFFKPNISTIVGSLYPHGSTQRDGGFTIFYMGINLGAAMAPLLCGYVGETFGWHYGFGLATIGMLVGLAVFVVPTQVARILILTGALVTGPTMVYLQDNPLLLLVNGFIALALVVAGIIAFVALGREGLPPEAGGPPDPELLRRPFLGVPTEWLIYLGAVAVAPALALLIASNRTVSLIPAELTEAMAASENALVRIVGFVASEASTPTGAILLVIGGLAIGYLLLQAARAKVVERQRLWVVLVLMFFSMLFWSFFEQAGTSINNFTDRNVDRVAEERVLTQADVGTTMQLQLTQEQLGYPIHGQIFTLDQLDELRKPEKSSIIQLEVRPEHVGMGVGGSEVPASTFQAANPTFILLFGLVFTMMWRFLGQRGLEPSTPVKFSLGLLQLGMGFGVLWYGATISDGRGMVGVSWLVFGYLLHTTGELCLSPVGLSMVTKLSPARLVSTVMGAWFLATAYSGLFAAIIAALTGVSHGEGEQLRIPPPSETVHVYGQVFGQIGIAASVSALVLLLLSPVLVKWMHGEK